MDQCARHCGDAVIRNGNVHDCINVVSRIDDTAARQQKVVALLRMHEVQARPGQRLQKECVS